MGLDMKTKKKLSEETAKRYCGSALVIECYG